MSPAGRGRPRAEVRIALVPLALLLAAWGASLTGIGPQIPLSVRGAAMLPDGSKVATQVIEAPASVSRRPAAAPFADRDNASIINTATTSGIPTTALAAYQRAGAVINDADPTCHLSWQLIAAIGRVESDHGRFGANSLDEEGIARPGIYGRSLNGHHDTAMIADTDAGRLDSDTIYDRAVGPMQFIPSTWSIVGVDGDNDGRRNPQDIDDAALATAVYLCAGDDDLSTDHGQRASLYRYNHSHDYVDLVLAVMVAYLGGEFASAPLSTISARAPLPSPTPPASAAAPSVIAGGAGVRPIKVAGADQDGPGTATVKGSGKGSGKGTPTSPPPTTATQAPPQQPTRQPTPGSAQPPAQPPAQSPEQEPADPPPLPTVNVTTLAPTMTIAGAQRQCLASGISGHDQAALDACIRDLMAP